MARITLKVCQIPMPQRRGLTLAAWAAAAVLCLSATGCMKQLQDHTAALAAATAPVIDQAAAAYKEANAIHEMRMDYDAVPAFEKDHSIDALRVVHPLIADKDVEVRLKLLTAFQIYVKMLVAISNDTSTPALDAAAKSAGSALGGLDNTAASDVASALGLPLTGPSTIVTTTTTSGNGRSQSTVATTTAAYQPISATDENILSTGLNALGQFLSYRVIQKDLPKQVEALDPQVLALCKLMIAEIDSMSDAEKVDFDYMLTQQKVFVMDPSVTLSEVERRHEIEKMQVLVLQQHAADMALMGLRAAIVKLAITHHALAAEEQGNNPLSLKQKLDGLILAGENLGKFYSSLP